MCRLGGDATKGGSPRGTGWAFVSAVSRGGARRGCMHAAYAFLAPLASELLSCWCFVSSAVFMELALSLFRFAFSEC